MTGADLANLVNEAALARRAAGPRRCRQRDLTDALEKVQLGTARNVVIPEQERRRTAYHEGGHALLGMIQPGADPVRKVSIIPRGRALGVTLSTPERTATATTPTTCAAASSAPSAAWPPNTRCSASSPPEPRATSRSSPGSPARWSAGGACRIGSGRCRCCRRTGDPRMAGISDGLLDAVDEEVRRHHRRVLRGGEAAPHQHSASSTPSPRQLLVHETLDEAEVYAAAGIERVEPV